MRILALDIGGTAIKSAITNEKGEVTELKEHDTNAKDGGGAGVMRRAVEIAKSYENFEAIGISTMGQVDSKNGVIVYANENIPEYTGTNVKKIFEDTFHVLTAVENDVNCVAVGETHFGAGRGFQDLLCLTYGTGVGGAIMINRRIYGGNKGLAGEFGHIITHPNGRQCGCGQHGCYEQYASTTALVREARKIDPGLYNGRLIFDEWHKGNVAVRMVVDDWIDEIVFGLVTLVHIFSPNAIILGGGILAEPYIEHEINRRIYKRVIESYTDFQVLKAELKNTAGLLGAAAIAFKKKIGMYDPFPAEDGLQ
jgi:glucokinase